MTSPDSPEKPDLLSLAERLTDGQPVDWQDAGDTAAMTALRLIERLRDGYAAEAGPEPVTPALPAGHALGRYRVEGVLGRGGMGVVYLARDLDLDREVAIKMLPPRVRGDSAALRRLRQEARLLASIDHPGIAVIHAMEEEAGERFLVLERVRGVSLAQRLAAGPMPLAEAVAVTAQIAEALHAAHDSGVVHRDLKPANVMLTPRGRVKVLDFGVAHVLGAGEEGAETRVAGTVGYMSPERLRGDAGDRRADVFAFGCVLFECLAGVPAFRGARSEDVQAAILGAELDTSPVPDTTPEPLRQLVAGCLAKDPAQRLAGMEPVLAVLGRAGAADARRAGSSTPHNLPPERTRFVGRERELDECAARLTAGALLTVTGPGGGGKTRFVSRLAERALDPHPHGVWFVDLTPVTDPSRVALAVASTLGLREQPGVPLSRTLVDHVRERRLLVVLDNCEHLLEACRTLIDELRAASAGLVVVAASREAFGLQGEQVYPLPPLATPEADEAAEPALLLRHASVALFVDRARLVTPDFALDPSTAPAVKEICRAMDGLPLAIELAAARVRVLTVTEIAARLDRLLALLRAPGGSASRRHATLRATLEWSVDALSAEERRAFGRLAVFAGGWNLAAAATLLDADEFEALDLIDALVHRSLVVAESRETETRYRYLEPVRQFALELLAAAGEATEARGRMVRHFVGLAETAGPALLGPDQSRWLDRLGVEHDNIQAALDACRDLEGGAESAQRIAGSLWRYWHVRGHLRVGVESVRRALAIPGAESVAGRIRAGALYAAGALVAFDMEGQKRAREHFEEALALFRAAGDDFGMARCLTGLGAVASARREFAAGAAFLREAQTLYRTLGDRRGLAVTLNNLGAAAWNQGDLEGARTSIAEALELARDAGDLGNVAQLSVAVALIDTRLGRAETARAHLRGCLSTLGALAARHSSAAGALLAAAELATLERRFAEAARWLGAADSVLERLGLVFDESDVWWKERDRCWARARAELSEETAEREYRAGRAMDRDQSLERALASLEATPPSGAS